MQLLPFFIDGNGNSEARSEGVPVTDTRSNLPKQDKYINLVNA